ncbi:MAG TPA: FCD domain-containing protein [Baekduia sp.]|uniref:FadR/GntR family transcriptional regulator n=1 Tax=Baekduia sp. TaxID=2600305 RepID=UPI002C7C3342|nr:FCD domain-containing protein [Baekduia sp.]HMJ36101.1 FCD domain-containing protein [Baekduia sp.]
MSTSTDLPSFETVFAPVRSQTAFEETLERLGTAIKLGLLEPGARLPAERELCTRLAISRSTLRQALTALAQSGHLHAVRGRGGGTFVAQRPPPADPPTRELLASWRDACDVRLGVELGIAALAADRALSDEIAALDDLVVAMEDLSEDFAGYRQADVRFHIGLAEATHSPRLVALATEAQGAMTDLISYIAHPPEILGHANAQHAQLLSRIRARDADAAVRVMAEHLRGTEHVLAGLLPGAGK